MPRGTFRRRLLVAEIVKDLDRGESGCLESSRGDTMGLFFPSLLSAAIFNQRIYPRGAVNRFVI